MFSELDSNIKAEAIEKIFKVQLVMQQGPRDLEEDFAFEAPQEFEMTRPNQGGPSPSPAGSPMASPMGSPLFAGGGGPAMQRNRGPVDKSPYVKKQDEPGRNDPCPCGSGKKYKKCHGAT